MGGSVILPSLTDQMLLGVFKYLVEAELRKNVPGQLELRMGAQDGMIAALVLMFGEADSVTAELSFNNGKTWTHVIDEITEDLQTWVEALENETEHVEIDFVALQDAVDKAVNDYALKHPKKFGDALRVNL